MARSRLFWGLLMTAVLIAVPLASVGAAGTAQTETTTPITGTLDNIAVETDTETGISTVLVTLSDGLGGIQTLRLSLETAQALGLVTAGPDGGVLVNESLYGQGIEIDPALVIVDAVHPVGSILGEFFSELLGLDYDTIMTYHEEGMGFGVIAQAGLMAKALGGDAALATQILDAKASNDFSSLVLPDGTTASNWGQYRQAVLKEVLKSPGAIISGRVDDDQPSDEPVIGEGTGGAQDDARGNNGSGNNGKGGGKGNHGGGKGHNK